MSRARPALARALGGLLAVAIGGAGATRTAAGQAVGTVEVTRPAAGDTIRSAMPTFTVVARGLGVPSATVTLELQVATTATFEAASIVFADTVPGDSAELVPARPLPTGASLWWRAIARSGGLIAATSVITGPRRAADWLVLVEPNAPNGVVLEDRRPRFVWSSASVTTPPGPWTYDIEIVGAGNGDRLSATGLVDTTFVPPRDLEANLSYRWAVTARLAASGDTVRVASAGSFVITSPDRPLATLLYQNFPNPFPTPSARATCIWFDLERPAQVQLEVLTLRGDRVRTLYPVGGDDPLLPPGRYGRADVGSNSGCNQRFAWDGMSDDGRTVAPGVYLLRLRVGGRWETRKILYRGG